MIKKTVNIVSHTFFVLSFSQKINQFNTLQYISAFEKCNTSNKVYLKNKNSFKLNVVL